jgi:hypothetical protein
LARGCCEAWIGAAGDTAEGEGAAHG